MSVHAAYVNKVSVHLSICTYHFSASDRTTSREDHQGSGDAGGGGAGSERPDAAPQVFLQVPPSCRARLHQVRVRNSKICHMWPPNH